MRISKPLIPLGALSLTLALLILVPYFLASKLTPSGWVYSGFLVNPVDGFSYLAKMRQGIDGDWLFQLPYTPDPGPPVLLFTFYLLLGHIARWTGLSSLFVYHGARVLSALVMVAGVYLLFKRLLGTGRRLWVGMLIALFGSGLGWISGPLGLLTSDLLIPESIPFFSALVNPHFPLALGLVAIGAALVLRRSQSWKQPLWGAAVGVGLGIVLPFGVVSLLSVVLVWLVLEIGRISPTTKGHIWERLKGPVLPTLGLALGSLPLLLYQFALTRMHPVLSSWNEQNQTPSPEPGAFLLGFGLVLILAVLGLRRVNGLGKVERRFLIVWVVVNALLLYVPFNLQRRFSLGLFLPLAALAATGLTSLSPGASRRGWLTVLALGLLIPSNFLVSLAGVAQVAAGDPTLLLTQSEQAGYQWMSERVSKGDLVLCAPTTGNRLPAFAQARVLYGHPFETPGAAQQEQRVEAFFTGEGREPVHLDALQDLKVSWIFYGPHEIELGKPAWLQDLSPIHQFQDLQIFRVRYP